MNKETVLGSLPNNTYFEMIGFEETTRNMLLVYANDSGCLIRGEMLTDGVWRPVGVNYVVSTQVRARALEKK